MNLKSYCSVCGNEGQEIERNNLSMFLCDTCGLFWRKSFELDDHHYEQRGFELENIDKINARYANSMERIKTLRKYITLDNVCDVGCGEGIFLRALRDLGYKNAIGLEPSIKAQSYALANNLKIFEGDIENTDNTFFKKHDTHVLAMFHVIEHLKNPKEVIKRIYNNLNAGDCLVIETPDTDSLVFTKTNYQNEFIYPEHLFYFNKNNLGTLLQGVGFKLLASGNRDFNENALSIRGALYRLGFVGFNQSNEGLLEATLKKGTSKDNNVKRGILKIIVRFFLSKAVKLSGRGNYLWIIVQK